MGGNHSDEFIKCKEDKLNDVLEARNIRRNIKQTTNKHSKQLLETREVTLHHLKRFCANDYRRRNQISTPECVYATNQHNLVGARLQALNKYHDREYSKAKQNEQNARHSYIYECNKTIPFAPLSTPVADLKKIKSGSEQSIKKKTTRKKTTRKKNTKSSYKKKQLK